MLNKKDTCIVIKVSKQTKEKLKTNAINNNYSSLSEFMVRTCLMVKSEKRKEKTDEL